MEYFLPTFSPLMSLYHLAHPAVPVHWMLNDLEPEWAPPEGVLKE
jgi:hypothetical protein